jgi:hypothetical protein
MDCVESKYSSLTGHLLILVFQLPVPMPRPEKRQTTGTEPKCSEAPSPNSVHSDYHPPSDDDIIDVEGDEDNGQDNSMVQLH